MPRRASSLGRANYVVGSGVADSVGRAHVLFGRGDPFLSIELAIIALDVVALFLVALVPAAGDFAGEIAVAESEGERQRECDGAEENGESGGDDLGATPRPWSSHKLGERNTAGLPT